MCRDYSQQSKEPLLRQLSTRSKRMGIWGDGYRVTLSIRAYLTTETESSLLPVLDRNLPIESLLTAANCLGILRRENRAGRKLDRVFVKALSETLRLWYNVAVASGTLGAKSICPTLRAQTGGHQGGHSDRPILCGEKLDVDRMGKANGVYPRLDGRRGRLIGNAVVPAIAEWIGRQIIEVETQA